VSQPIDLTYVELRARGEDDAARDIRKAIDSIEDDVERASQNMEESLATAFQDAARSAENSLGDISDDIDREAKRSRKSIGDFGDAAGDVFDEVEDAISGAAGAISGGGGGGGGSGLLGGLTQLGTQMRALGGLGPIPILAGIAAAIPAVIALGGALADLSAIALALPAAVAVLGASFATLKVAFSGMGDAVSALASGDLEKINEAMKNLAPAAQSVAREINALREPFSALRKEVQQAFFAPLVGDLTELGRAVLPTLRGGMRDVASAFGELGSEVLNLLGQNDVVESLGDIFESTARIVRNISPEIVDFLGTLFGVIEHGLPFVEKVFDKLGSGIQSVSDWLGGAMKTGDFEKFLDDALATLGDLWDLGKSVFNLLGSIFGDAGDEGRTFIQTLTELTQKMADFFNSAEGQEVLQKILDALPLLMASLEAGLTLFGALVLAQNSWLNQLGKLGGAVVAAGIAIGNFFQAAWDWIKRAGSAIGDFFISLGEWFAGVGQSIADAWGKVTQFGGQVVDFIKGLPGQILSFLQGLPAMLGNLFTTALNQAAYWVGFGIGTIIAYFRDLPGTLWERLQLLITFVTTAFTTVRDRGIAFVLQLVQTVTTFFTELPGKITAGVTALVDKIQSFFSRARDTGQSRIRELVNAVGNFFSNLPERISGALNNFRNRVIQIFTSIKNSAYNIGRDIINGIKNGITDAIQGAVQLAKNAAKRIAQGFKDALSISSPSKLMAAEVGVPMMQGVGVGLQQGMPNVRQEIEQATQQAIPRIPGMPTSPGAGAAAAGTVITFDQGAVQVVFEGVVPSEDEAWRTGSAVGDGIAQTLQRRNVRTLVRTT
jgi:phage-related protein